MTTPSDYLWDGSGEPDPEIAALEDALRPMRYQGAPPRRPRRWGWALAAAAGLALAAGAAWLAWPAGEPGGEAESWPVQAAAGCPDDDCRLEVGEWLEPAEEALLEVADIGFMRIEPGSRLRIKASGEDGHRLELARGRLSAAVVAPPRLLIVETPAATAVDLGCAYELAVDPAGAGSLSVSSGWVALEAPGRVALVPAGARAEIRPGKGPGTPLFEDAPPALAAALAAADANEPGAVAAALAAARPVDTLSLWHLLPVASEAERGAVYDRLAALHPAPLPPLRAGALALDPAALDALWIEISSAW